MTTRHIYDANGSVVRTIYHDDADDALTLHAAEDVEPLIESAKALAEQPMPKDMRPVAHVPTIVIDQAMREGWINDQAAWRRWLNNPDNRPFRIWGGRL